MKESILEEIKAERKYQDQKWGKNFDEQNSINDWITYLVKYASRNGGGDPKRKLSTTGSLPS